MSETSVIDPGPTSEANTTASGPNNCAEAANMCLELALEGERLCKGGDCRAGIAFFQAAIQAGTDDLRTLSAIYSQLGNAYFYLGDYGTAIQFHRHDLQLARSIGDKLGEAKSSGNLGNTFKVMGRYDEALICCKRHLELAREIGDKLSESRALYNLGNVYHAKGKQRCRSERASQNQAQQNNPSQSANSVGGPGELLAEDVRQCLQQAIEHYRENLELMRVLGDSAGQGRACGNLGNTHYLLGDFPAAIKYHTERLKIAREFGDKAAERRANSNLGNSHIFLGEFEQAAKHYRRTLVLAQELEDEALEAQACYSLGNTHTLLHDYAAAVEYHLRHLLIAQKLKDRIGEGRACWSLGNAYTALGNPKEALNYARNHLQISQDIGDTVGQATAQINVEDLEKLVVNNQDIEGKPKNETNGKDAVNRLRRRSMDNLSLIKLTPDSKNNHNHNPQSKRQFVSQNSEQKDDVNFFELLSRFQSTRMEDQRCEFKSKSSKSKPTKPQKSEEDKDELANIVSKSQSGRMDEQRVSLPYLPGLHAEKKSTTNSSASESSPDNVEDSFIEMLVRFQAHRLDDQRTVLPDYKDQVKLKESDGSTVPEEDLFSLVQKHQAARMEDQRALAPKNS